MKISSTLLLTILVYALFSLSLTAWAGIPLGLISSTSVKCEEELSPEEEARQLAKEGLEKIEIILHSPDGRVAATFTGLIGKKGSLLTAGDFEVVGEFKRQGYGREIARRILERYPHIERIESELFGDNCRAFEEVMEDTGKKRLALQDTPSYKIWSALGFTRYWMDSSSSEIRVIYSKPKRSRL